MTTQTNDNQQETAKRHNLKGITVRELFKDAGIELLLPKFFKRKEHARK